MTTQRKFKITRRGLLRAGLAGAGALATAALYANRVEPHWRITRELPLALPNLPPAWAGKKIVHISDLHVGYLVSSTYLMESLQLVNDMQPDMIVITGDFMSCQRYEAMMECGKVLAVLKRPALGIYACHGNHDYGTGWKDPAIAATLETTLPHVTFLRNASVNVDGLTIAGVDDYWCPNFDPKAVLLKLRPSDAAIVLCHNPDVCDLPVWGDFRGWVLSGHTHGGQCKPPFLPPPLLPVHNSRYTAGLFELSNDRTLYINPGLGYVRRIRFNVRPEITKFTLTASESA
jgi:uncharacterized protein